MKESQNSEKQIVYAVRQIESGTSIGDDRSQLDITEQAV